MADPDTPGVRVLPPTLFAAALLVAYGLHWVWPLRLAPPGVAPVLRAVGIVLVIVAIALALSAWARFRRAGTNVNPMKPVTALVRSGPYRFTRNPMYLSLTMITVGVAAFTNSPWPLVVLIPTLVILQGGVIGPEERFLERKFGEEYRAYKARVRRWL